MSNLERQLEHLKHHVEYPSNRKDVVAACNNMADVPADDRAWFEKSLPEGTYNGPNDVVKALLAKV